MPPLSLNFNPRLRLLGALFAVSAASIGFEIMLTRYFAIASWSEYGYWVISIAMAGYSASGVVLSLFRDFFFRRARLFFLLIPLLLPLLACWGFYQTTLNPFNPLELQDPNLWGAQFKNICQYYGDLFPVFFLSGLYISLCFLALTEEKITAVYAADLVGAGAGALVILAAMFLIQPFYLLSVLIPFWALAALLAPGFARPWGKWAAVALVLLAAEWGSVNLNQSHFCVYKAITPALNVSGARVERQVFSPWGYYMLLENFTEREDIDLSNDYVPKDTEGPPLAYGLYLDGNRISSLPKSVLDDFTYVSFGLDSFPYLFKPGSRTLLVGTRGGFRVGEILAQHATRVIALENDPNIFSLMRGPLSPNEGPWLHNPDISFLRQAPEAYLAGSKEKFDLIDLSSDYLDQADANKYAFTREALLAYWNALSPGGVVSLPVNIREFTVYALKLEATAQEALENLGIPDPVSHLALYRSAWNARLLMAKDPWSEGQLAFLKTFCDDRSFDLSYYKGIKPGETEIFNDLPPTLWTGETDTAAPEDATDSLRNESLQLLSGQGKEFRKSYFFNLYPSTHDRPFFYSVLRLSNLGQILNNLSQVPREEIGSLINLAVLAQSLLWALLVMALPLLKHGQSKATLAPLGRTLFYFSCLGLGFLFIEIMLIEKGAYFLGDRTVSFSLVLSSMLVFSGLGSWLAGRFPHEPKESLRLAGLALGLWLLLSIGFLDGALSALLSWPVPVKCLVWGAWAALASISLGFFFPLGLIRFPRESGLIPWAWALNGAFSVVATPLANLLTITGGFRLLTLLSLGLYGLAFLAFPSGDSKNEIAGEPS